MTWRSVLICRICSFPVFHPHLHSLLVFLLLNFLFSSPPLFPSHLSPLCLPLSVFSIFLTFLSRIHNLPLSGLSLYGAESDRLRCFWTLWRLRPHSGQRTRPDLVCHQRDVESVLGLHVGNSRNAFLLLWRKHARQPARGSCRSLRWRYHGESESNICMMLT